MWWNTHITECPFPVKCLETGVILESFGLLSESLCSSILDLNGLPVHVIKYTMSLSSHEISLGKSMVVYFIPVIFQVTLSIFLIMGQ